jgi:hypothetical protein
MPEIQTLETSFIFFNKNSLMLLIKPADGDYE